MNIRIHLFRSVSVESLQDSRDRKYRNEIEYKIDALNDRGLSILWYNISVLLISSRNTRLFNNNAKS